MAAVRTIVECDGWYVKLNGEGRWRFVRTKRQATTFPTRSDAEAFCRREFTRNQRRIAHYERAQERGQPGHVTPTESAGQ